MIQYLEEKKISEILPDSFWDTNFWLYWQTMFAFQRWSSALEMKRYLCRYCHHIDGLPLSLKEKVVLKKVIKAVEGTDLEILLKESGLLR